jgi:hypothetical protein
LEVSARAAAETELESAARAALGIRAEDVASRTATITRAACALPSPLILVVVIIPPD